MTGMPEEPVIYIVSDSVGDTAEFVVKAVAAQFDLLELPLRRASFVEDRAQIKEVLKEAASLKAIVAYTLVVPELRLAMAEEAARHNVPTADLLGGLLEAFSHTFKTEPHPEPGRVRRLDEQYFARVAAVEFAVKHDDGKDPRGLLQAEVVLIGISRTSQTPLSMYLAHQGIKVANLPLVPEVKLPAELFLVPPEKIIGLIISPRLLRQVRRERLKSLGLGNSADYVNQERISRELSYARQVMQRLGCTVFDVSNKAVEEVANRILQNIEERL